MQMPGSAMHMPPAAAAFTGIPACSSCCLVSNWLRACPPADLSCLQVRGVTKKGKEFFRFTSTLTDAITHLDVADAHIWAACQQVHNHFVDGQDQGLWMAPDIITATEVGDASIWPARHALWLATVLPATVTQHTGPHTCGPLVGAVFGPCWQQITAPAAAASACTSLQQQQP